MASGATANFTQTAAASAAPAALGNDNLITLLVFLGQVYVAAYAPLLFYASQPIEDWYRRARKSPATLPWSICVLLWFVVQLPTAAAAYIMWNHHERQPFLWHVSMGSWVVMLVLVGLLHPMMLRQKQLIASVPDVVACLVMAIGSGLLFSFQVELAAGLMLPMVCWMAYLLHLQVYIMLHNDRMAQATAEHRGMLITSDV